jgi:hypothetical protein
LSFAVKENMEDQLALVAYNKIPPPEGKLYL